MLLAIERSDPERIQGIIDSILLFFKIIAIVVTSAIFVRLSAVFGAIVKQLFALGPAARGAAGGIGKLQAVGRGLLKIFGRQVLGTVLLAVTLPLIAKALSNIEAFQFKLDELVGGIPEPPAGGDGARIDAAALLEQQRRRLGEQQLQILAQQRNFNNQYQDLIIQSAQTNSRLFD